MDVYASGAATVIEGAGGDDLVTVQAVTTGPAASPSLRGGRGERRRRGGRGHGPRRDLHRPSRPAGGVRVGRALGGPLLDKLSFDVRNGPRPPRGQSAHPLCAADGVIWIDSGAARRSMADLVAFSDSHREAAAALALVGPPTPVQSGPAVTPWPKISPVNARLLVPLLDLLGAGRTVIEGGASGGDSLVVADNLPEPQRVSIDAGEIRFLHGSNLLSQPAGGFVPTAAGLPFASAPPGNRRGRHELLAIAPDPAGAWWNVARGPAAVASQSSTAYGGEAGRAIDGNTHGHWDRARPPTRTPTRATGGRSTWAPNTNWITWSCTTGPTRWDEAVQLPRDAVAGRGGGLSPGFLHNPRHQRAAGRRCRIDLPGIHGRRGPHSIQGRNNYGDGVLSLAEVEVMGRSGQTGLMSWAASAAGDLADPRSIDGAWSARAACAIGRRGQADPAGLRLRVEFRQRTVPSASGATTGPAWTTTGAAAARSAPPTASKCTSKPRSTFRRTWTSRSMPGSTTRSICTSMAAPP